MNFSLLLLLTGCQSKEADTSASSLPEDTQVQTEDSGMGWFAVDTSFDTGYNTPPALNMLVTHTGEWELSPAAGPYQILVGEMSVQEIVVDNSATLWCDFQISLTGEASGMGCPTCDFGFMVEFYVHDNPNVPDESEMDMDEDPEFAYTINDCLTPDLPNHEGIWQMGYSGLEGIIYLNYENSGFWLPWYPAYQVNDSIYFDWETTLGVYGLPGDD